MDTFIYVLYYTGAITQILVIPTTGHSVTYNYCTYNYRPNDVPNSYTIKWCSRCDVNTDLGFGKGVMPQQIKKDGHYLYIDSIANTAYMILVEFNPTECIHTHNGGIKQSFDFPP